MFRCYYLFFAVHVCLCWCSSVIHVNVLKLDRLKRPPRPSLDSKASPLNKYMEIIPMYGVFFFFYRGNVKKFNFFFSKHTHTNTHVGLHTLQPSFNVNITVCVCVCVLLYSRPLNDIIGSLIIVYEYNFSLKWKMMHRFSFL